MLIVALVMAVIGLAALVTAIVSGNEVIAWVCIGASVIGVVLLIIDAVRERQQRDDDDVADAEIADEEATGAESTYENYDAEYPSESTAPSDREQTAVIPAATDPPTETVPTVGSTTTTTTTTTSSTPVADDPAPGDADPPTRRDLP